MLFLQRAVRRQQETNGPVGQLITELRYTMEPAEVAATGAAATSTVTATATAARATATATTITTAPAVMAELS